MSRAVIGESAGIPNPSWTGALLGIGTAVVVLAVVVFSGDDRCGSLGLGGV